MSLEQELNDLRARIWSLRRAVGTLPEPCREIQIPLPPEQQHTVPVLYVHDGIIASDPMQTLISFEANMEYRRLRDAYRTNQLTEEGLRLYQQLTSYGSTVITMNYEDGAERPL